MNEQVPTAIPSSAPHTRPLWLALAGAGALLAIGGTVYQGWQIDALRRQSTAWEQDHDALRAKVLESDADLQKAIASLRQDLADTKEEANADLTKAEKAATRHADILAQRQKKEAEQLSEELGKELGKVKETTDQANSRLDGISSDVGSVKTEVGSVRTDVDAAKTNIEATNTELQRVRGDMGVMSGLVATNGKEIQMLRDLGDRNIYEFTLAKSAGMQRVGNIQVALRKADMKRNRYTVDVLADDKRVAKQDKGINEPVQFYVAGARQPYELVVNTVKKDQVIGYLATPKVTVSRLTPATADSPQP